MSSTIGSRIKELRKAAGLTQKQLGIKVGVEPGSAGNWERDERMPDLKYVFEMIEVFKPKLGDQTVYLLTGRELETFLTSSRIDENFIAKKDVVKRTQEYLYNMDEQRDLRMAASISDLMDEYVSYVINNKEDSEEESATG